MLLGLGNFINNCLSHKIITFFRQFRLRRQRKWFFEHYGHPDEAYFRVVLRWIKTGRNPVLEAQQQAVEQYKQECEARSAKNKEA